MNFKEAIKRAENLSPERVTKQLFQEIRRIEDFLIDLNILQIQEHKDSFDNTLENSNQFYTGFYSQATAAIAQRENPRKPKTAGQPYNFEWSGDFIDSFLIDIQNETISLNSTGTGSGDKAFFFEGYTNLFGLTDDNLSKVVKEKLLPFFIDFFRKELTG